MDPSRPGPAGASADPLTDLNDSQRAAVTHGGGPLLVLAGAGSGKTRVITHRIAHLVRARGVAPWRIVAVTFTNKAAAEMRERVVRLLGSERLGASIGTFHSLCLRILRRDGERIGLERGFTVYDSDDQIAVVKRLLKAETGEATGARGMLSRISRAKNALQTAEFVESTATNPERKLMARVYRDYESALRQANAADFDDLLVRTLDLFSSHPDVCELYADRCEHLLVDEYQDTNRPQYRLIRQLASRHGNVCVVGDEDQSIYRFRGAEIRNILDFEADYDDTLTIRLEQNYRSSGTILKAAGAVIANNFSRKGKTLWTENPDGHPLELFGAPDDRAEAIWVSQRIRKLEPGHPYHDIAVLYRTNAQSRLFEEIFRRDRIPYQVVGTLQFYERKEVKDILSYLKLAANHDDDVAFRRVVNTPPRGIGAGSMGTVEHVARTHGVPLLRAALEVRDQELLSGRAARQMGAFLDLMEQLAAGAADRPVTDVIQHVVDAVDYEPYLARLYAAQAADRMDNVRALVSAAAEYVEESENGELQGFLDRSALVAGSDLATGSDEAGSRPGVTLMTIHCAKGLEFPVVFLVGLEEELFPHAMSTRTAEDVEEERRLCYVAMTRAKQRLLLTLAHHRRLQGAWLPTRPSRFLEETPSELVRDVSATPPTGWNLGGPTSEGYGASGGTGGSSAVLAARRRAATPSPARPARARAGQDPGDGFAVGALVQHPKFGGGQIVDREGSGSHLKLKILFSDHGAKTILPSYTTLRVEKTRG